MPQFMFNTPFDFRHGACLGRLCDSLSWSPDFRHSDNDMWPVAGGLC